MEPPARVGGAGFDRKTRAMAPGKQRSGAALGGRSPAMTRPPARPGCGRCPARLERPSAGRSSPDDLLHVRKSPSPHKRSGRRAPRMNAAPTTFSLRRPRPAELVSRPDSLPSADDAMAGVERDNRALADARPKDYARPTIDGWRLGRLVDMIAGMGRRDARRQDLPNLIYECLMSRFAGAEDARLDARAPWFGDDS